jgi:hypothetical protein
MLRRVAGLSACAIGVLLLHACGGDGRSSAAARDRAPSGESAAAGSAGDSGSGTALLDSAFADSVERIAEQRELLEKRGGTTYLPALLAARDGINHRWRERPGERMRVWVQDIDPEHPSLARRIVAEAFNDWTESGIPVAFTIVLDSTRAEVLVTWVEQFEGELTGITHWSTDPGEWIVAARIELARRQPTGTKLDSAGLASIARHEVGHLLGLDHVDDLTSIMAARIRVSELSETDRRTIRLVYELPAGRLPRP